MLHSTTKSTRLFLFLRENAKVRDKRNRMSWYSERHGLLYIALKMTYIIMLFFEFQLEASSWYLLFPSMRVTLVKDPRSERHIYSLSYSLSNLIYSHSQPHHPQNSAEHITTSISPGSSWSFCMSLGCLTGNLLGWVNSMAIWCAYR